MGLELLTYAVASVGAVAVLLIIYSTRFRKSKEEEILESAPESAASRWRTRVQRSIPAQSAKQAEERMRTLSLEREILSDAIRRLYEAHAEGIISEDEREELAKRYKSRMLKVKDAITEKESIIALHELEAMQEDLTKLFNERFEDLNNKIEALRSQVGVEPEVVIDATPITSPEIEVIQLEKPPAKKTPSKRTPRRSQKTRKTVAEERIEKIRSEVEKVLDRLEQMEAED